MTTFTDVFPRGETNDAYAQYFTGQSYLQPLVSQGAQIANVTFEPGCRNNWHIHHTSGQVGQILLCTSGRGWHQAEGEAPRELHAGDVVVIEPGVKALARRCTRLVVRPPRHLHPTGRGPQRMARTRLGRRIQPTSLRRLSCRKSLPAVTNLGHCRS